MIHPFVEVQWFVPGAGCALDVDQMMAQIGQVVNKWSIFSDATERRTLVDSRKDVRRW
ncbi:hypothetical protein [Streptacidiphilus sp. P02-A3a]|uniref:hypothetical protein n=1 Tax=Streptacidiphilus sp. P02-A3a TaxID=2704468 RepID=UPI0015F7C4FD|nr:hypothetical protein [Streptacidiphilus sp. P02-A3a]QMU70050.1 hypothetical protein GXP74_19275 [Streptacidiphilus sp. P02-A3a]